MLIRLYSVYDRVACIYADPFSSPNDATAARAFNMASSSPDSMLYASPQDYQLWYLGSYDNRTGDIESAPFKVCDGKAREVTEHE